jgi:hypothetical protein
MALSADGKVLAVNTPYETLLFDSGSGKESGRLRPQERWWDGPLALSSDGKFLAAGLLGSVKVWEIATLGSRNEWKSRSAAPACPLEATVTSKKAAYSLDLGGKTPEEFARTIRESTPPGSPLVDLVVTLRNTSDKKVSLDPKGEFDAYLIGDGAMNHPEMPYQTAIIGGAVPEPKKIVLAPGESHALSLTSLYFGHGRQSYWLLPGQYTLYVSYHTGIDPAPEGWSKAEEGPGPGYGTLRAAPIRLKVVAEKK